MVCKIMELLAGIIIGGTGMLLLLIFIDIICHPDKYKDMEPDNPSSDEWLRWYKRNYRDRDNIK